MKKALFLAAAMCAAASAWAAAFGPPDAMGDPGGATFPPQAESPRPGVSAARVVMVGVDGLGARWIPWDEMPNLSRLRDEGVFAVGRCHRPTASAINWKSVFSGLPPELHGYNLWNSKEPGIEPPACVFGPDGAMPDLFSEIRRQKPDARTVSLYAWGGLGFCHATNVASVARHFGGTAGEYAARDSAVFDEGLRHLAEQPLFLLLYQGQVDSAGHATGWGSPEYLRACRNVDANIGRLIDALHALGLWDDTAVVFVADHGGLDKGHGGKEDIRVFEVPFLVSGGAARGLCLREPVLLMDAAPTILSLLGLDVPASMRGRPAAAPAYR